ncbi:MAG: hypothetical protein ACFFD7_04130 [Candidatus Thorarchaeota archaeon]
MIESSYYDYIYKVEGETIKIRPERMFDPSGVYLIVDKELKLIWIWAGSHSRLFHRYMAANWAGKLKTRKKFYNFKYEVIKQDIEPTDFHIIIKEINNNLADLAYPGQSRQRTGSSIIIDNYSSLQKPTIESIEGLTQDNKYHLTKSERSHMKKIFSEIKEIQMHIKYSMDRINERFAEIEKIIEK